MLSHLGGKEQIKKMGCSRHASNPMVALFNILYPFVLGKPHSETWNSDVPGGNNGSALPWACASQRQSAFQREAVFSQSSAAAQPLLNSTCFTCLAMGYSWGSLELKVWPPQVTLAVRSITPVCLHQQRQPRDCLLRLEGQHAEHKKGTGPRVTCRACIQFGKSLIHPNLNKLGLYRGNHTGKQLHICSVYFLQMDPGSSRRLSQWWAAVIQLEELTSLCPPQAHKMAMTELWKIDLKWTWEVIFPLFDPIAILYLFFPTGIFHILLGFRQFPSWGLQICSRHSIPLLLLP